MRVYYGPLKHKTKEMPRHYYGHVQRKPAFDAINTSEAITSLLQHMQHALLKPSSVKTYEKHLAAFARRFPVLPVDTDTIIDYLSNFRGSTGRNRRNQYDILKRLYVHIERFFQLEENPFHNLARPRVTHKQPQYLSLEEVRKVDQGPKTIVEEVVWQLLVGHSWRQVEVRRILAGDVRGINRGSIWCRGKERNESTPILPETQALLELLALDLLEDEAVIRSRRIRNGSTEPLGENGLSKLIKRLLNQADLNYKGHDLRRTFATLAVEAGADELLVMRLLRDKVPGVSDRYITYGQGRLLEALMHYSPLRLIKTVLEGETASRTGRVLVETGESRTPRPEESHPEHLQA